MNGRKKVGTSLRLFNIAIFLMIFSSISLFLGLLFNYGRIFVDNPQQARNICYYISLGLSLASSVLELIALCNTSNVNSFFHVAFYNTIASLVFSVLAACFMYVPGLFVLYTIFDIMSIFCGISVFFIYILALSVVHAEDKNEKLIGFGKIIEWLYVGSAFVYLIFISIIVANAKINPDVSFAFAIISLVASIACYVVFMVYVMKSRKSILNSNNDGISDQDIIKNQNDFMN